MSSAADTFLSCQPCRSGAGQRHAGISPRCRLPRRQQSHTVTQALSYWQPLLLTTLPVCKCLCAPVQPDTVTQQQASGIGGLTSLLLLTLVVERQAVDNYVSHQPAIPVFTCLLQVQVTYHNRPHTGVLLLLLLAHLMRTTKFLPLYTTVAKGQYRPNSALPSGSQIVEWTVQPWGTIQSFWGSPVLGVPGVTVCGVLVAAQPDHLSKFRTFFHSHAYEAPSLVRSLLEKVLGRGRWSLKGNGRGQPAFARKPQTACSSKFIKACTECRPCVKACVHPVVTQGSLLELIGLADVPLSDASAAGV